MYQAAFPAASYAQGPGAESSAADGEPGQQTIGIWSKSAALRDAPWTRRKDKRAEWYYWANVGTIAPRRNGKRIVLLGESVARGYLYDPVFNPAIALQGMLEVHYGKDRVSIVDLAKTNLTAAELVVTAEQCLTLDPDMVVIFAGNNWRWRIGGQDLAALYGVIRRRGVPGVKAYADAEMAMQAAEIVKTVSGMLKSHQIPATWIVPEFNLRDWSDPQLPMPLLAVEDRLLWLQCCRKLEMAIAQRDATTAAMAATSMLNIDGGSTDTPLRALADIARDRGETAAEREYLEQARDAAAWNPHYSHSPRITVSIQRTLLEQVRLRGDRLVDVRAVLERNFGGGPPDRRTFFDYCHLTADGINATMAETASSVVAAFDGAVVPAEQFMRGVANPGPGIESEAAMLAAIHNAHYGQSAEVVRYWCERALTVNPELATTLGQFACCQSERVPAAVSSWGQCLVQSPTTSLPRYLMAPETRRLDTVLVDVIDDVLKGFGRGQREGKAIRKREHSVRCNECELLDFYYASVALEAGSRDWTSRAFPFNRNTGCDYAKAYWSRTRLQFVCDARVSVALRLTCRVPYADHDDVPINIFVNDRHQGEKRVGRSWTTLSIIIHESCVNDDMNTVVVEWPLSAPADDRDLERAADRIVNGMSADWFHVYGEVQSLTASLASTRQA